METLAGLWLPIVVSAVLVFVASSLIWNVLGAHKWHIKGLPDEAAAREALLKQAVAPGMYSIPYCPDPAMMKDPAFKEKLEKGPVAVLTVRKPGMPNMGEFLGAWFVYLLFVSYVVALVCGQTLHRGDPYLLVFRVAGAVAFAGYSFAPDPERDLVGAPLEERAQGVRRRHRLRRADRRHFRLAVAPLGVAQGSLSCPGKTLSSSSFGIRCPAPFRSVSEQRKGPTARPKRRSALHRTDPGGTPLAGFSNSFGSTSGLSLTSVSSMAPASSPSRLIVRLNANATPSTIRQSE